MLRELNIRKLNDVVFIEVKAKRYEDNYKELCLMIDYIIKNSYSKLESFDIDEKFEACFSSNKLEEIIKKAREYAEMKKSWNGALKKKTAISDTKIIKEIEQRKRTRKSPFLFILYFNTLMY